MRMSTRGRYAVRAMIDLALNDHNSPVQRQDIAQRQGISIHYLEQLLVRLRRANLVEAVRGPGGGYRLARSPEHIRISAIVIAVEGPLAVAPCLEDSPESACPVMLECAAHYLWRSINDQINAMLDGVTLADLGRQMVELAPPAPVAEPPVDE